MNEVKLIQTNIRLPPELRKKLKILAIENDTSLQEIVTIILQENIDKYK